MKIQKQISWVRQSTTAISYCLLSFFLIFSRVIFTQLKIVTVTVTRNYLLGTAWLPGNWVHPISRFSNYILRHSHPYLSLRYYKLEQLQPQTYSYPPLPFEDQIFTEKRVAGWWGATLPCLRTIYKDDFGKKSPTRDKIGVFWIIKDLRQDHFGQVFLAKVKLRIWRTTPPLPPWETISAKWGLMGSLCSFPEYCIPIWKQSRNSCLFAVGDAKNDILPIGHIAMGLLPTKPDPP